LIGTRPVAYTMALGAVATGIINAHDAEIVIGTISKKGWTPLPPKVETMGATRAKQISVVAVLDANSVKKDRNKQVPKIRENVPT